MKSRTLGPHPIRSAGLELPTPEAMMPASPHTPATIDHTPIDNNLPRKSSLSNFENARRQIANLERQLAEKDEQQALEANDAFKFEQILRACVAQQADTIEQLNNQIKDVKREHELITRALEKRIKELEHREEHLEQLRVTTEQFLHSLTYHKLYV